MEQSKALCNISEITDKKSEKSVFGAYDTAVGIFGFLLARAMPIVGFSPFGVSFLTMERRFSKKALMSTAMVILGYISLLEPGISLKYMVSCVIYIGFLFIAGNSGWDISPVTAFCSAGIAVAFSGLAEMIWTGFSLGGILMLVCDTVQTLLGAVVFEKSRRLLSGKKSRLYSMNNEEKVCMLILLIIAVTGLKTIRVYDFICAANIVGIWIIAVVSLCGGVAYATLCGAVLGIVLGAFGDIISSVALFTACGIVGGIMSRFGKTAVCVGLSLGGALFAMYCAEQGSALLGFIDIPLGALAIIFTSDRAIRSIGRITGIRRGKSGDEQYREGIKARLESASSSFRTLAETFMELSDKKHCDDVEDISMLFDSTAERVCRGCSRISECWVVNFNSTYKTMFRMLEVMDRRGELTEADAEELFEKRCLHTRPFVREMNRLYEIYKINCVWKSKLCENRELAGEQLGSVAQILDSIAREIDEERVDIGVEEEVRARLSEKGIGCDRISVTVNAKGRYTAFVEFGSNTELGRRTAETALRATLGVKMVAVNGGIPCEGGSIIRFSQPEGYRIESGVACRGKDEESGDNWTTRYLSEGKYAAAISDGMGTGHRASRDSGATVRLLGDFLEAGFDKTVAVRLINSIMVMKSANEAFSTVDMCVIDLYSGEVEFVKNGAEPSYIKRKDLTETVRSASLPVGVMQDMEIETFAHRVEAGDMVIMISDGLQMKKGHEEWIKRIVDDAEESLPPQVLADRIMDMAETLQGGEINDDMTVIVLAVLGIEN